MDSDVLYYPKELSWLAFNERVLQEAADKNNPAVERIRFLGIYSNNLDEFYRVRAADVKRQITIAQNDGNEEEAERQTLLMAQIQKKVVQLSEKFDQIHKDVLRALARYNIHILRKDDLDDYQRQWVRNFFVNKVLRHIAPILIDKKTRLIKSLKRYLGLSLCCPATPRTQPAICRSASTDHRNVSFYAHPSTKESQEEEHHSSR